MKKIIILISILSFIAPKLFSQATFNLFLRENPAGEYNLQLISTSNDNTDVIIAPSQTSLHIKVPSGQSITPTNGWISEVAASSSLINSVCGYTPSWDLIELSPTSDVNIGNLPNGTNFILTSFTLAQNQGYVYAFEDNVGEEPCVTEYFDNNINVDIDGGSASFSAQSLVGTTQLPIELYTFQVEIKNQNSSLLKWKTLSEINSSHFEIFRNSIGDKWEYISKVPSNNTLKGETYSFIDKNVYNDIGKQTYYYRLKMVDLDGGFKYSNIEAVDFDSKFNFKKLEVFPNPTNNKVFFKLTGLEKGSVLDVSIYDNVGKLVFNKNIQYKTLKNLLLDKSEVNIKSGVYNVAISDNEGNKYYKKLVLTR